MLILAGISIVSLTENGLFEKAKLAKQKQENAEVQEEATLGDYENEIGEYIDSTREQIMVDKNTYEQLLKDVADLKTKNSFSNYSTDEQIVGKWIDGKNIYRKVYTGLSVATGTTKAWVNIVTVNGIDALINTKVLFNNNREEYIPLEYYYNGSNVQILTTSLTGASRTITTCILEYTKTNN